ncbi:hypothetical protein V2P20_03700 [Methylobacter sp. Wu1]|uniref:hypothetical protein n=1 Tax=Methylobacter sp. Wu1 TaxID=3119359 RepID=UPI002F952CA9
MTDNVTLNVGSGGDTIAADDIAGVKFQRVKLVLGNEGVNDGDASSTNRVPVALDTASQDLLGALAEAAPATDTASSGLNGRLQRIAQHLTATIALFPAALTAGGNFKAAILEALPAGTNLLGKIGIDQTTPGTTDSVTVKAADGIGSLTEAAPATDTASSGLNGRLQRIAQRLTSLIALFPAALTAGGNFKTAILEALPAGTNLIGKVGIDQTTPGTTDAVTVKALGGIGSLTEPAPATDTASSGLNGRLQRIAQNITSLIGLLPAALTAGGNLKAAILEALPAGTNLLGKISIDQTTTGSTNAVYSLETSDLIEVVLSTDTLIYAIGDVLADTQPVAGVTRLNDGTAMLQNLIITDADDQGQAMDIVFLKSNVSLGAENAAVSITDTNAKEIVGIVSVAANDFIDLVGVRVAHVAVPAPIILKAAAGTTTVYIAAISRGTGTYTATGLSVKLGLIRV